MSRQALAGYSCGDPAPPSILRAPEAQGGSSKLVLAWKAERWLQWRGRALGVLQQPRRALPSSWQPHGCGCPAAGLGCLKLSACKASVQTPGNWSQVGHWHTLASSWHPGRRAEGTGVCVNAEDAEEAPRLRATLAMGR